MNCRKFAVEILIDILNEGKYNNISLRDFFKGKTSLSGQEKAFITELVNGTIRNLIFIDYVINLFSSTKTEKMKPLILNVLRVSVYQIKFMPNLPSSAICNEAVKIVKARKFYNLAGFVNGLLRNIDRNKNDISLPDKDKQPIKYLSILYSIPQWIVKSWLLEFDFSVVEKICKSSLNPPRISICVNSNKVSRENLKKVLESEKMIVDYGHLTENSLYISRTNDIASNKAFNDGLFHIMDESSMLAVEALGLKPDKTFIDVCSAPGGKSFYASYLMKNSGVIFSRDIHKHKIQLIEKTAERLSINIIKTQLLDATLEDEKSFQTADYLLVDAPCSGFGILRKKPDIKYSKTETDLENLIILQRKILSSCHKYVKKGGVLVYSTCTINRRENIENVEWFCENYGYELCSLEGVFKEKFDSCVKNGYIQILPYMYDTDGFFIAKMIRKE